MHPAIFLGSIDPKVAGFVFGERESEQGGGDEPRVAREESQRQRAGRLFVAR